MITKEQIINILDDHSFKVYQHGDVVAKSDFYNIADCIVKNLNIPAVSNSVKIALLKQLEELSGYIPAEIYTKKVIEIKSNFNDC